jgi:hypothetical protein
VGRTKPQLPVIQPGTGTPPPRGPG